MVIFFQRQHQIEGKILEYLDRMDVLTFSFKEAFKAYLERTANFDSRVTRITKLESEMDRLRRSVQISLYRHKLMPDSREAVLHLLDALDTLPNQMEQTVQDLQVEKPQIPEILHSNIMALLEKTGKVIAGLIHATENLFGDLKSVRDHYNEVLRQESETDEIEFDLLHDVFHSVEGELAYKLQLKRLIRSISEVADMAEDAVEKVAIMAIVRMV